MSAVTTFSSDKQAVPARATAVYTAKIVDQNGNGIPDGSLETLVLSIYDVVTKAIVNGIEDVDILNAGRGVVDTSGNLTLTLEPGDTAILASSPIVGFTQERSLVLDWTYNGGNATGRHQVNFFILPLAEP